MSKDYEVGFGKTPKHTRWKEGQSGNPRGRPKGRKNMRTIMNEVLDRSVTITEGGRTRKVKFMEAFMHQLAAKALNGSTRDQIAILKALHDYAPELLKETNLPQSITVRFVDSDGNGRPADRSLWANRDTSDNDPKASPAREEPDSGGDDERWLE